MQTEKLSKVARIVRALENGDPRVIKFQGRAVQFERILRRHHHMLAPINLAMMDAKDRNRFMQRNNIIH